MNLLCQTTVRRYALLGLVSFVVFNISRAQEVRWVGPNQSGTWSTTTNWSTAAVPTSTNDVLIDGDVPNTRNSSVNTAVELNSITFDNQGGNFNATAYRVFGASGTLRFNTAGQNIITAINNATTSFNGTSNLSALTINLNYSGYANIHIDANSQVSITANGTHLTGTGGLIKTGEGVLRIGTSSVTANNSNTNYTGGFELREGIVQIAFSGSSLNTNNAFGTGTLTLSGGTLGSTSDTDKVVYNNVTLNGTVNFNTSDNIANLTVQSKGGGTTATTLAQDSTLNVIRTLTWTQAIGESGGPRSLTKTGSGTLVLDGSNTYTGGTIVSDGTLTGNVADGDLSIASGATYGLGSASRTVATLSGAGAVALGAHTLTVGGAANSTFSGAFGGTGGITKSGSGTLTLSGASSHTGLTTVTAGGLALEGSLAGALSVSSSATLSGSGTIGGAATISGAHNPGSSPGIQTFNDDLTYTNGASVTWELAANTVTRGDNPTANYDQIIVGGTLDFSGSTTLDLAFNTAGSTVNWNNAFWDSNQSWLVYDAASLSNFSNLALATTNWADGSGNLFGTVRPSASFALGADGSDVRLYYTAIPEPSTYAALFGAAALALAAWRRRQSRPVA